MNILSKIFSKPFKFLHSQQGEKADVPYPKNLMEEKDLAKSAVTGGHPEEINGMPADTDLADPNPVYDGHDLSKRLVKH